MKPVDTKIIQGDCKGILADFPENTFDLIVTSPPYADQRKNTYGGVSPNEYNAWFLERSAQFLRVLKPTGTFILNIKEKVAGGERHTYVIELILELRKQGWLWTEEFIWHKKNCHPGKWPNRFRDAWERCLQFNKTRQFHMYQEAVMVPMGDWAKTRLRKLGPNDTVRLDSRVKSGFGKNIANWVGREMAYPDNVLHFATECGNKNHSAAFPSTLPRWFIQLFTQPGDWVLDPFTGSGTTNIAAKSMGRNSVGIELSKTHAAEAAAAVAGPPAPLYGVPEIESNYQPKHGSGVRQGEHPGFSPGEARQHPIGKPEEAVGTQESLFTKGEGA
jgi:DNA modification methylase